MITKTYLAGCLPPASGGYMARCQRALRSSFRANSHTTMPAVTETLSECFVPNCGISRHPSLMSTTS